MKINSNFIGRSFTRLPVHIPKAGEFAYAQMLYFIFLI